MGLAMIFPKTANQCLTMLNRRKDATVRQPRTVPQQQAREGTGPPKQED